MRQCLPHPIESGNQLSLAQLAKSDAEARRLLALSAIYPFGGVLLPDSCLGQHFMYLGQSGSAKTLEMRQAMRMVLGAKNWLGAERTRHRALVYDKKGEDVWPSCKLWCPPEYLVDLHPYSEDGVLLHLGKSCTTAEDATELARAMIPESAKTHDFFVPIAQQLMQSVIFTLQDKGVDWTMADIIYICTHRTRLVEVMRNHPLGEDLVQQYLPNVKNDLTNANIAQTLTQKLAPWLPASLLERQATRYITIDGWLNSGGVLVLRGSSRNPDIIERWNAFVFRLLLNRLRDRPENYPLDETFVFVDEMPEAVMEDYRDALLLGRIKGVRTAATIQDPGGIIRRFGGRDQAAEVIGQIGNLCVGRLGSAEAAETMAKYFGKRIAWHAKPGSSVTRGERTESVQWELREDYNIYPYDFQNFPVASLAGGYQVAARVPSLGAWRKHVDGEFVRAMLGPQPSNDVVRRRRVLRREDFGFAWSDEQRALFGMSMSELLAFSEASEERPKKKGAKKKAAKKKYPWTASGGDAEDVEEAWS